MVLVGARIHRLPGDPAPAAALAVRDGMIVAIGSAAEARAAAPDALVIDAGSRVVAPSFTDSHTHFHRASVLSHVHLDFDALPTTSIDELLGHVRTRAAERPAGSWIEGDSLTEGQLAEGHLPDRHALDRAAPAHPVLLRGIGKHVVAANSLALAAAGITRDTPDPDGGRIVRDVDGEPTGILHERAKLRLDTSHPDTVVPPTPRAVRLAALRAGQRELHRHGITTIHEMIRLPDEVNDWTAIWAAGELDVRVRLFYRIHETPLSLEHLEQLGMRCGIGDDWLRIEGVKISVDGWCIFRNAAVHEPYAGDPANTGILRIDQARLDMLVRRANAQGLRIALHAVGSRAIDAALAAFEAAGPAVAGPHRIEHAYLDVNEAHLHRIREQGLVWSVQPGFIPAYQRDWDAGLGGPRADGIMPIRRGIDVGIPVIFNSDAPSGPIGPLAGIVAAHTRQAGTRILGAEHAITALEAWRAYTSEPARLTGEQTTGTLEVGRMADLVILNHPGTEDDVWASRALRVDATMIAGRFVHDAAGLSDI